ncbi:MAG: amidohydrolase [Bacteroidetes bacterium]|nr:amidohydrolase [Bacteroidota bacterium]
MQDIRITIIQSSLFWESHKENRKMFSEKILSIKENTDIILLPEMFSTGFSMNPYPIAEDAKGETFQWMLKTSAEKNAVIAGSVATKENGRFYNRFYWVQPDGNFYQYDKKHLFTFAGEHNNYTAGKNKVIISYKGWKFLPLICYDLRFPVWSKNNYSESDGFDYDCLIYVANWPKPRNHPWKSLLIARAIENQSYVAGINRVGNDANNNDYSGDSAIINSRGEYITQLLPDKELIETATLSYSSLYDFRQSFRVGNDWDRFEIK